MQPSPVTSANQIFYVISLLEVLENSFDMENNDLRSKLSKAKQFLHEAGSTWVLNITVKINEVVPHHIDGKEKHKLHQAIFQKLSLVEQLLAETKVSDYQHVINDAITVVGNVKLKVTAYIEHHEESMKILFEDRQAALTSLTLFEDSIAA